MKPSLPGIALVALLLTPGFAEESFAREEPLCRARFHDATAERGIEFVHARGARGEHHLWETMGGGVAVADFDGDGDLDLYFVQSFDDGSQDRSTDELWLQRHDGSFERAQSIEYSGYGQGVAVADIEGDGDLDLLRTRVGTSQIVENRGGALRPASSFDPANERPWGTSAAWGDVQGDGRLDVYVAHYLDYDPAHQLFCGDAEESERTYCDPSLFEGLTDALWVQLPDASFQPAHGSSQLPFSSPYGRGLGVLFQDFDGDGRADLYVANDLTTNLLLRNVGGGAFEDESLFSGTAVNSEGRPEAGMGLVAADFDRDADADLVVTNFDVETNTYYRNDGSLSFVDVSSANGLGLASFNLLGFGIVAADFDLDGALDIFVGNGHIFEQPKRANVGYEQPNQLLLGDGAGTFEESSCALEGETPRVSRGVAVGDLDHDGDADIVVADNDERPTLWENRSSRGREAWLGIELRLSGDNSEAIGATVTLRQGEERDVRWISRAGSYLSASDARVRFAVDPRQPAELEIRWPDGVTTRLVDPPLSTYSRVVR